MKLAIFVITLTLVGAILAAPQEDKPEPASERTASPQDKPEPASERIAKPQDPQPLADRQNDSEYKTFEGW